MRKLSFPYPLRFLFASKPEALSRCLAVVLRAIETDLIRRADLTRACGARTGAVTVVQRFGSALNLNVHLHMLIPDGVYTFDQGMPCFHEVGPPPAESLQRLTAQIVRRVYRRLVADGWLKTSYSPGWTSRRRTHWMRCALPPSATASRSGRARVAARQPSWTRR